MIVFMIQQCFFCPDRCDILLSCTERYHIITFLLQLDGYLQVRARTAFRFPFVFVERSTVLPCFLISGPTVKIRDAGAFLTLPCLSVYWLKVAPLHSGTAPLACCAISSKALTHHFQKVLMSYRNTGIHTDVSHS